MGSSRPGHRLWSCCLASPWVKQDHLLHDLCSQQSSVLMGSRTSGMLSNAFLLWAIVSLVFSFPEKTEIQESSFSPSIRSNRQVRQVHCDLYTHPGDLPSEQWMTSVLPFVYSVMSPREQQPEHVSACPLDWEYQQSTRKNRHGRGFVSPGNEF